VLVITQQEFILTVLGGLQEIEVLDAALPEFTIHQTYWEDKARHVHTQSHAHTCITWIYTLTHVHTLTQIPLLRLVLKIMSTALSTDFEHWQQELEQCPRSPFLWSPSFSFVGRLSGQPGWAGELEQLLFATCYRTTFNILTRSSITSVQTGMHLLN
jgi:hypothetical protein